MELAEANFEWKGRERQMDSDGLHTRGTQHTLKKTFLHLLA